MAEATDDRGLSRESRQTSRLVLSDPAIELTVASETADTSVVGGARCQELPFPDDLLQLSQRSRGVGYGITEYNVVVTRIDTGEELLHGYAAYSPQAGPVRPDRVYNLRLCGTNVMWEWSENAFDLASPGACFSRPLTLNTDGQLDWAGPVVRTPKLRLALEPPTAVQQPTRPLRPAEIVVTTEWKSGFNDEVKVLVSHAASASKLEWVGGSSAESQSLRALKKSVASDGMVRIEFVYHTSENGSSHAVNMTLFVQLGTAGIEWVSRAVAS
jgi:hypothetical protein